MFAAAMVAFLFARRIERPIRTIATAARAVASGHLNIRVPLRGPGEIVEVASQLNRMLDIREKSEQSLRESAEQIQLAMDAAHTGNWSWYIRDDKVLLSDQARRLLGIPPDKRVATFAHMLDAIHSEDRATIEAALLHCAESGEPYAMENRVIIDGSVHWLEGKGHVITDVQRKPGHFVGIFMDITERMQTNERMRYLAMHDPLTGLLNRREFENRLQSAIKRIRKRGSEYAVLYMDLDQFKVVNDTCGHSAGDELLRQLSSVFSGRVRETDALARLGGDEFAVLLENCPLDNARQVAEELRQGVADFRFGWQDKSFGIGISIGLVAITDNSMTLEQILSAADAACFVAKDQGRNRIHIHHPGDDATAKHQGQMEWVARIHKAFEESQFRLYFQTIQPLNSNATGLHCELLLRLQSPSNGLIPPMAFIPAAERYGLMPTLDRWVIQSAFRLLKQRQQQGQSIDNCAINLSATSFNDEGLLEFVRDQFAVHDIPPQVICFEVTESAAIANLVQARRLIMKLKMLGCRFALDDFGSGMSSFTYLKNLPVDYLKIDGSFVRNMARDPIDRAMVEAIHNVGHVMGIKTVAEFVESPEVIELLRTIGVDYAQGYGIAVPMPFDLLDQPVAEVSAAQVA